MKVSQVLDSVLQSETHDQVRHRVKHDRQRRQRVKHLRNVFFHLDHVEKLSRSNPVTVHIWTVHVCSIEAQNQRNKAVQAMLHVRNLKVIVNLQKKNVFSKL